MSDGFDVTVIQPMGLDLQVLPDGQLAILFQTSATEGAGYSLDDEATGLLLEKLLKEMARKTTQPAPLLPQKVRGIPVPAQKIDIRFRPSDPATALLSIQCGGTLVTFALDLAMLFRTLRALEQTTKEITSAPKH